MSDVDFKKYLLDIGDSVQKGTDPRSVREPVGTQTARTHEGKQAAKPPRNPTAQSVSAPGAELSAKFENVSGAKPKMEGTAEKRLRVSDPLPDSSNAKQERPSGLFAKLWRFVKWTIISAVALFVAVIAFGMYLNHGKSTDGESGQGGADAEQTAGLDAQKSPLQQPESPALPDSQPGDHAASAGHRVASVDVTASVSASTDDDAPSSAVAAVEAASETAGQTTPAQSASASAATVGMAATKLEGIPYIHPAVTPGSGGATVGTTPAPQTSTINQVAISGAFVKRCGWIKNELPTNLTLTDRDGAWRIVSGADHAEGVDKVPAYSNGVSCGCIVAESNRQTMTVTRILTGTPLPAATCQRDRNLPNIASATPQSVYTPPPSPPNQYIYVKLPDGRVIRELPTGYWPRGYTPHN